MPLTLAKHEQSLSAPPLCEQLRIRDLLDNVAVDPRYHGQGIGRALLGLAEAEARRQRFDSIYLYTHERMTENQGLYIRIGYVEYDRRTEQGYARVYMRKPLPAVRAARN